MTPRSVGRGSSPVSTAMTVLRCFSPQRPVLGVVEIAELIGLHKSSVSRMLGTLESEGLVEQDPLSKKYRLALGLLRVAGSLLTNLDVRRAALPVLAALTAETGETSSLMMWDGSAAVSVEQVPSPHVIKHSADIGTRYLTIESSSVRVFLAAMTEGERRVFLRSIGVSRKRYEDLAVADIDGVCVNDGLTMPDEIGVGAPAFDHRGMVAGAVLISAPRYRVDAERRPVLARDCRRAAADLTAALGGENSSRRSG